MGGRWWQSVGSAGETVWNQPGLISGRTAISITPSPAGGGLGSAGRRAHCPAVMDHRRQAAAALLIILLEQGLGGGLWRSDTGPAPSQTNFEQFEQREVVAEREIAMERESGQRDELLRV